VDKNLKTCLIVVAVLVFLGGLVTIGSITVIYLNRDKIADGFQEWTGEVEATVEDGRGYSEGADQKGCVDEGLRRVEGKSSLAAIGPVGFVNACLQTAAESDGFCDGVPGATEIWDSAFWAQSRCEEMGKGSDQGCQAVMQAVMGHCQEKALEE